MPEDSSAKNRERRVLESGKSLSPIMFDAVLQNFTPDLPTGMSARPRYVMLISAVEKLLYDISHDKIKLVIWNFIFCSSFLLKSWPS